MNQLKHKRIFIIGHPGAGKALLAKALAEKLGWQFIDADLGLESRIGRTLVEIAGKKGEEAFLHCESEILNFQLNKENIVVTTDASIIANGKNRQILSSEFVVYLKVSTSVQLERISRNPERLLPVTDLKIFLEKLHHERDSLYEQAASLTINSDNSALEEHVLSIVKMVSGNQGANKLTDKLDKKDLIIFHKIRHTPVHLTDQQAKCLKLLAQGKSSKEIAQEMKISHRTVEDYIAKTMEQLGCSSSKELIALYHGQP